MTTLTFKRLVAAFILISLIIISLSGCTEPVKQGKVVQMQHTQAYVIQDERTDSDSYQVFTGYDEDGYPVYETKWKTYKVPIYVFHPESWHIVIQSDDNEKGEMRSTGWYIAQSTYDRLKLNDQYIVLDGDQTQERTYTRDVVATRPGDLLAYRLVDQFSSILIQ